MSHTATTKQQRDWGLGIDSKPDRWNLSMEFEVKMLIRRWQAPVVPDKNQIVRMFEMEGLEPFEEIFPPEAKIEDHRHPFDEVRMVANGELLLNIAGNQLLLRPGDRIVIPSNTKHSKKVQGSGECICICAKKAF